MNKKNSVLFAVPVEKGSATVSMGYHLFIIITWCIIIITWCIIITVIIFITIIILFAALITRLSLAVFVILEEVLNLTLSNISPKKKNLFFFSFYSNLWATVGWRQVILIVKNSKLSNGVARWCSSRKSTHLLTYVLFHKGHKIANLKCLNLSFQPTEEGQKNISVRQIELQMIPVHVPTLFVELTIIIQLVSL